MRLTLAATAALLAATPPAAARSLTQTLAAIPHAPATLTDAGEGRRDWLKLNCYGCHGMNAAGAIGPNVQGAEQGDVTEILTQGSDAGMPSFRKYVTATDIKNVTAYLASIGTASEPKWVDWWVANPSK